jgi:hypothetical protein
MRMTYCMNGASREGRSVRCGLDEVGREFGRVSYEIILINCHVSVIPRDSAPGGNDADSDSEISIKSILSK